jgi:hypothetical protein
VVQRDSIEMKRKFGVHFLTFAVLVLGIALRVWLLRRTASQLNSDEAYSGLQSLAILAGDKPVVIRGIGYTGVVDSYLLAPFLWLFGPSLTILKAYSSVFWAISSVLIFRFVRRLDLGKHLKISTDLLACTCGSFIWLSSGSMMLVSTKGYQSYGQIFLFSIIVFIGTFDVLSSRELRLRKVLFVGGSCGFAIFLHPISMVYVLPALIAPCFIFRNRVRNWWIPLLSSALFVNIPFLVWNVKNGWLSLSEPSPAVDTYLERLARFFSGLIPRALGLMNIDGTWTFGLAAKFVYVLFGALVVLGLARFLKMKILGIHFLLITVLIWPLLAGFSTTWFVNDGRYAIVGFPFLVLAFSVGLQTVIGFFRTSANRSYLSQVLLVVVWLAVFVGPWLSSNSGVSVSDPNAGTQQVIEVIETEGFNYAAGNYWLVQPIEYLSGGQIHVAVAGHPWGVRFPWRPKIPWGVLFPERQAEVMAAYPSDVAYVFLPGDEQVGALRLPVEEYERREVGGAVLYLPLMHSVVPE